MTGGWSSIIALMVLAVGGDRALAADGAVAEPAATEANAEVEFIRVHVPAGRIRDLPLDGERLVPMSVAEFEKAAARLGATTLGQSGPRPLAEAARYAASIDELGRLVGTLEFEVGGPAAVCAQMPLGEIAASGGRVRTSAGAGEAAIFALPEGGIAMQISGSGTYSCRFTSGPSADHPAGGLLLPLVPALVTRIDLTLADGVQPIVTTGGRGNVVVAPPSRATPGAWRIDLAGLERVGIAIAAR
jgi:hypothetical protein